MPKRTQQIYRRIDTARLEAPDAETATPQDNATGLAESRRGVRWSIIPLSALLCVVQAVVTVLAANLGRVILTATLISVLAFAVLFLFVLVINPLLRVVFRQKVLKPLNRAELMCVFTALMVTSGVSTFGLSAQLVPLVGTPWNPEWNTAQRGWQEEVLPHLNESLFLSVPEDATPAERDAVLGHIRAFRKGLQPIDAQGKPMPPPPSYAPLSERAVYWWAVAKAVPWGAWVGPLTYWLIFVGACYAMFYSLTYVVLGFWVRREKIIFPLAQIPEQLLPDVEGRAWWPWTLRQTGFWAAFAMSFLVLCWNGAVAAQWIPGMGQIKLGMSAWAVEPMVKETALAGLSGGQLALKFLIIFTAIGLAFLLPTEISFSLWFYFLVGKVIILMLVWVGYGQTGADFPSDWNTANNTITAQGGGALLMFAGMSLARALGDYRHLARGKPLGEQIKIAVPVIGLVVSLAVIAGWLMWSGLPVVWALLVTVFLTLLTIGLMRVVAEGGIHWFQIHTSPFHFYSILGLGQWLKASAVVPLIPIYWVLFLDVKTFLAPNLTNAAKMQEDVGTDRRKFHLNIVLCLVISVVVALAVAVYLAHLQGGQRMNYWFYSAATPELLDRAQRVTSAPPSFDASNVFSYLFGSGWVMLSIFLRRTLFWFPHPIGYVMLVNPLMAGLWFSFFIGWVCKKLVVRYGGKSTFDCTRPIFIGLIMGELIAIVLWTVLGLSLDFSPGLSLNRHGP